MGCFGCSSWGHSNFAALSKAAAKSASAKLRKTGMLRIYAGRGRRESVCAGCSLRTMVGGVAYCGKPFLQKMYRPAVGGCGCPIVEKAASINEHCPLATNGRAATNDGSCNCRWCVRAAIDTRTPAAATSARR